MIEKGTPVWFAGVGFGCVEWALQETCGVLLQNGTRVRMAATYAALLASEVDRAVADGRITVVI